MKGERNEQVDRSIDKIENARGLSLLMNERLVNIVKKRVGGDVRGPTRAGWVRRGIRRTARDRREGYACTRNTLADARTRAAKFNVCVTAGRSRNGGGGGGAEIYIMFIMLT